MSFPATATATANVADINTDDLEKVSPIPTAAEFFNTRQNASISKVSTAIVDVSVIVDDICRQSRLDLSQAASIFHPDPICRESHDADMRTMANELTRLRVNTQTTTENGGDQVLLMVDRLEGLRRLLVNAKRVSNTQRNDHRNQIRRLRQSTLTTALSKNTDYTETQLLLMALAADLTITHRKMIEEIKQTYKSQSRRLSTQIYALYNDIRVKLREFVVESNARTGRVIQRALECRLAFIRACFLAMIEFGVRYDWRDDDTGLYKLYPVAQMRGKECWLSLHDLSISSIETSENCVFEQQINMNAPPCSAESIAAFHRAQRAELEIHLERALEEEKAADQTHQGFFSHGPEDEEDVYGLRNLSPQPWCCVYDVAEAAAATASTTMPEEETNQHYVPSEYDTNHDDIFTGHTPRSVASNVSFAAAISSAAAAAAATNTKPKKNKKKNERTLKPAAQFKVLPIQPNLNRTLADLPENETIGLGRQDVDFCRKKQNKNPEHAKASVFKSTCERWNKKRSAEKARRIMSVACCE